MKIQLINNYMSNTRLGQVNRQSKMPNQQSFGAEPTSGAVIDGLSETSQRIISIALTNLSRVLRRKETLTLPDVSDVIRPHEWNGLRGFSIINRDNGRASHFYERDFGDPSNREVSLRLEDQLKRILESQTPDDGSMHDIP